MSIYGSLPAILLLLLSTVAHARPQEIVPRADPTCGQSNIPDVIASIKSERPHPSVFCSAYLKIPANVKTIMTTTSVPATSFTSTSTSTATVYSTTSTRIVISKTTVCVAAPTKGVVRGRIEHDKLAKRRFKSDKVSSACSCIYPAKTGYQTRTTVTITAGPTVQTMAYATSTITTISIATSTSTQTVTAAPTGKSFYLKVTSLTNTNPADLKNEWPDSDPTGKYVYNNPGAYDPSSTWAGFSDTADTLFALNACNQLSVVGSVTGSAGAFIGNVLSIGSEGQNDNGFDLMTFSKPKDVLDQGVNTAKCQLGQDDSLTCAETFGDRLFHNLASYQMIPALMADGEEVDTGGDIVLTAIYPTT